MADFSDDGQLQKFIAQKYQALHDGKISQEEYNAVIRDAKVGIENFTAKVNAAAKNLQNKLLSTASNLASGKVTGASVYNDAIETVAELGAIELLALGPFGWALAGAAIAAGKYVTSVNKQADALFENYQDISRSGLAVGMKDTFDGLQKFGYTVEEIAKMGQLLKENSIVLAQFGGTAYTGAGKFAELAATIQDSEIGLQFQRMGMSVDEINRSTAGYLNILYISGELNKGSILELKDSAVEYLTEQTRLTKITGLTADQQNKNIEAAMSNQQFAGAQLKLQQSGNAKDLEKYKLNRNLVSRIGVELGEDAQQAFAKFAGGAMSGEDIIKFRRTFPTFSRLYDEGELNQEVLIQAALEDIPGTINAFGQQSIWNKSDKYILNFAQIAQARARLFGDKAEDRSKKAKSEIQDAKDGKDKATAAQVKLLTSQRNIGQSFDKFYNQGIVPVTGAMNALSTGLSNATGIVGSFAGKKEALKGAGPTFTSPAGAEALLKFTGNSGSKANFDQLQPAVKNAFMSMIAEYGKSVTIESANRTYADQKRLYDAWEKAGGSASNPIVNVPGMGRIRMPNKPGTSPHENGRALDVDLNSYSGLSSLLGKYGFKTVNGDPGHIQMANGGIATGPKDGYNATLHGTEAVIPMDNKKAIPVNTQENMLADQQSALISLKITKLDELIRGMQTHYDTSNKILMRQS